MDSQTRSALISYARLFGVEIDDAEEGLTQSVAEILQFLADIDVLDLMGVQPAASFDPRWPVFEEGGR